MELEELQIVISVQSEQVQAQVNSVIGHINNLSSSVASTTAGITQSFTGMSNTMAQMGIGTALGSSMRNGMSQATMAIKQEMAQITAAMKSTASGISSQLDQIGNRPVEVTVKLNTEKIKEEAAKAQAEVEQEFKKARDYSGFKGNIAGSATKDGVEGFSTMTGNGDGTVSFTSFYRSAMGDYQEAINKLTSTIEADARRVNAAFFGDDASAAPTGTPGGPSGGAGHYDSDDDVPSIRESNRHLSSILNRLNTIQARMSGRNQDDASDEMHEIDNDLHTYTTRLVDAVNNVRDEVSDIKTYLHSHMGYSGGGGSGGNGPIIASRGGLVAGAAGAGIMSGMAGPMVAIFAALGIGSIIKTSITDSMNAVESESLFNTVFGGKAEEMRDWSTSFQNPGAQMYNSGANTNLVNGQDLGLNPLQMRSNTAMTYAMTTSMGVNGDDAVKLSQDVSMLTNDLSSFYNLDPKDAYQKIRSGLTGEAEPLKAIGILVDDATVKNYAYTHGLAVKGEALTNAQKVEARYQVIMAATNAAQGDLARTINSPANQMRLLNTQLEMMRVNLGNAFMPIVTKVIPILVNLVKWLNTGISYVAAFMQALFGKPNTGATDAINTSATAAQNAAGANNANADAIKEVSKAAEEAKGSLMGFDEINSLNYQPAKAEEYADIASPEMAFTDASIGGGSGAFDAMSGLSEDIQKNIQDMADRFKSVLSEIFAPFKAGWEKYGPTVKENASMVFEDIKEMGRKVGETLGAIWNSPQMQGSIDALCGIFSALWTILCRIFDEIIKPVWNAFFDMLNPDKNPATAALLTIVEKLLKALQGVLEYLGGDGFWIVETFLKTWAAIWVVNKIFLVGDAIAAAIAIMKGGSIAAWIMAGSGAIPTFLTNMGRISGLFAGLGPALAGGFASIGGVLSGVGASIMAFLAPVGAAITAAITAVAVALGIPFAAAGALIAAAIAAVVAGIYLVWKHWDDICKFFSETFDSIKEWGADAWKGIQDAWSSAGTYFSGVWSDTKAGAKEFWEGMKKFGSDCWDGIKKAWDVIKDVFNAYWKFVGDSSKEFWALIQKAGKDAWEGIKKAWDVVTDIFNAYWKAVGDAGSKFWEALKTTGISAWDNTKKAWDVVGNVFGGYWNTVTTSSGKFWGGMKDTASSTWENIKTIYGGAGSFFSGIWGNVGTITDKLWTGMKTSVGTVFEGIKTVFNSIVSFVSGDFKSGWDNAWNGVVSGFKTIISGIGSIFKIPLNLMIDGINTFIRGLNKIQIPEWVPGVGGNGFNIKAIPHLAKGGIIDSPTIAEIGEAGPEVVMPLENTSFVTKMAEAVGNSVESSMKRMMATSNNSGSGAKSGDVILKIDSATLGKVAIDAINNLQRQTGKVLLKV